MLGEGHRPEFHGTGEDNRLLGNDSFMEKCLTGSDDLPLRLTIQEIAETVCIVYGIAENELKSPSQNRSLLEARSMLGWFARESCRVTLSEVGNYVNRDVGTISSAVRRLSDRMRDVPELAERADKMKTALENLNILDA